MAQFHRLAAASAAALILAAPPARLPAQSGPRVATTAAALVTYPVFYNGRTVVVRGELRRQDRTVVLIGPGADKSVYLQFTGETPADGRIEVRGQMVDLGRLSQDDSRLAGVDVEAILDVETEGRWPRTGEVSLIRVTQSSTPPVPPAPSVRALALEPDRYEGHRVNVVGRFRGANLYGDLPQAPGKDRWEFVVQSADAAVWVSGLRPRGNGLNLDPRARVDTGRWVGVSGVVRREGGLVWIDGQDIRPAEPSEEQEEEPATIVPPKGPPPEVAFSAPIQNDTDIETTSPIRIQFSRDMKADSFRNRVLVEYLGGQAGETPVPPAFTARYRDEGRVLEIRFDQPLERFRTVRVELVEGIESLDGVMLAPWTLTFSVGAKEEYGN